MKKDFKVFLFLLALLLFFSCSRRTVYVPVEAKAVSVSADSLLRLLSVLQMNSSVERSRESVSFSQTSTFTLNEAGDTISKVVERERDSSSDRMSKEARLLAIIDSLSHITQSRDTVEKPVPYPVESVREVNSLRWWQTALMWSGAGFWLAVLIILASVLFKRKFLR